MAVGGKGTKMRRRTLLKTGLGAAALAALSGCSSGTGGGQKILRLAINQTEKHPSYIALKSFGDSFEKATDGEYRFDIFANEMLGAQQEILNLQRNGIVDLAIISSTQLENINRNFRVFNMPSVFSSVDHQMRVINDEKISGELFNSLVATNNLKVLGGFTQGERNLYTKKAVSSPAELSGMKIRVQESPVMLRMVEAMGGNPAPMAYGEVYTALQAGVLDGAENNEVSYQTQKHFEVAPHYVYTRHLVGLDYMVASNESLTKMRPEIREKFDAEWTKCWQYFVQLWSEASEKAIEQAKAGGAQFHEIDNSEFAQRLGPLAESLLDGDVQRRIYQLTKEADR